MAAGGGTLFFDMPLNSTPCTVNAQEFDKKHAALSKASITDFGLWGGLVPGGVGDMEELAARGVVGFKAFLCDSGLPEFPRADDLTLYEGLREAGRLGLVCCGPRGKPRNYARPYAPRGSARKTSPSGTFLRSRPILAEVEAIHRAAFLARAADAPLYIVHVSSGAGVAAALEERARGTQVTIETCAHYLYFTEEDVERLGAIAKCAPPLRSVMDQGELWDEVLRGTVSIVASDHSPAPPEMKTGDFWGAWGGIAGVQSTLAVLLEEGYHKRDLPLQHIAALVSALPAERFRLAGKGSVAPRQPCRPHPGRRPGGPAHARSGRSAPTPPPEPVHWPDFSRKSAADHPQGRDDLRKWKDHGADQRNVSQAVAS